MSSLNFSPTAWFYALLGCITELGVVPTESVFAEIAVANLDSWNEIDCEGSGICVVSSTSGWGLVHKIKPFY